MAIAPNPVPNPNPAPAPAPPALATGGSLLREGITAAIGLAITSVALIFLWDMYFTQAPTIVDQAKTAIFNGRKDLLMIALGFLGTVTGYYLGRVPAERQADVARSDAKRADARAEETRQTARSGILEIQRAHNSGAAGGAAADPVNMRINDLLARL